MALVPDMVAALGVPLVLQYHGTSGIVYRDGQSDDVYVTAALLQVTQEDRVTEHGIDHVWVRDIIVSTDPDGDFGGVASPALTATVVIQEQEWSIERAAIDPGGFARITLTRPCASERTRRGYRTR